MNAVHLYHSNRTAKLTLYSLDDPILPSVLTSLAANLARSGNLPSQRRRSQDLAPESLGGSTEAHGDVQDSIKDIQVHTSRSSQKVPRLSDGRGEESARGLKDSGDGEEVPVRGWSDARDVLKRRECFHLCFYTRAEGTTR